MLVGEAAIPEPALISNTRPTRDEPLPPALAPAAAGGEKNGSRLAEAPRAAPAAADNKSASPAAAAAGGAVVASGALSADREANYRSAHTRACEALVREMQRRFRGDTLEIHRRCKGEMQWEIHGRCVLTSAWRAEMTPHLRNGER